MNRFQDWLVPAALIESAQLLDAYYISARYPNGFPAGRPADYFNQAKAGEAVHAAQEIIRFLAYFDLPIGVDILVYSEAQAATRLQEGDPFLASVWQDKLAL